MHHSHVNPLVMYTHKHMHHSHVTPFVMQHATFLFTRKENVKVIEKYETLTLIKDVCVLMNAFVLIICLCVLKHGFSV